MKGCCTPSRDSVPLQGGREAFGRDPMAGDEVKTFDHWSDLVLNRDEICEEICVAFDCLS